MKLILSLIKKLETIKNFEHNYIFLNNGKNNFNKVFLYEEKNKILIKDFDQKEID